MKIIYGLLFSIISFANLSAQVRNKEIKSQISSSNSDFKKFKSVKIGTLEVAIIESPKGATNWYKAKSECQNLGNDWRLPTIEELKTIAKYKEYIMPFDRFFYYWSSSKINSKYVWIMNLYSEKIDTTKIDYKWVLTCAVRSCEYVSPPIITNTTIIGELEILRKDLELEMDWYSAIKSCEKLGSGWRLPNKDELNVLFENMDRIGGFKISNYWSSSINPTFNFGKGQNFWTGMTFEGEKKTRFWVRPVRNIL